MACSIFQTRALSYQPPKAGAGVGHFAAVLSSSPTTPDTRPGRDRRAAPKYNSVALAFMV